MKIPKPYFKNIPIYGDLEMDKIIIADFYPVLFILKDRIGNLFLALCCEIRKEQRWIVNKVSKNHLIKLLANEISAKELLISGTHKKVVAMRNYDTRKESFDLILANEIDVDDLPSDCSYIDAEQDEFKEYIERIRNGD